jgi:hypothetical protein
MAKNLLDITQSFKTVQTRQLGEVNVPGLSLQGISFLLKRHPVIIKMLSNQEIKLDANAALDLGLDVVASIIAAGLGYPNDETAEAKVKELNPEDAFKILEAVFNESFPGGVTDFLERMNGAFGAIGVVKSEVQSNPNGLQNSQPEKAETSDQTASSEPSKTLESVANG